MSIILSIETATEVCSVALHDRGKLLGRSDLHLEKSHSNMLAAMIEQLTLQVGISMSQLEAVAVSKGPGSYTGLRIGLATAKGLCFGLGVPLIAVNTLLGLFRQLAPLYGDVYWYCPMLDARRMEVYALLVDHQGQIIMDTVPVVVSGESFQEYLEQKSVLFFGNGAAKCRETITNTRARFVDGINTSAVTIGELAYEKFQHRHFEDLAYFEPFYLKEFRSTKPRKQAGIIKQ